MKKVLYGLFFSSTLLFSSIALFSAPIAKKEKTLTFKDRLIKGNVGDFVVISQQKVYTLLMIRSLSPQTLVLEAIAVPENQLQISKISWTEWVANNAPGHTSWMSYQIDLEDNNLQECYSFTNKEWLYFDLSDYLYKNFLTLPLKRTPLDARNRIGPPPPFGEEDHRSLWSPPLVFEGKKKPRPLFEVFSTTWPNDGLDLSGSELFFYFDGLNPFPFPYWLEIKTPHYTFKLPIVDSGKGVSSPQKEIPLRPPLILGSVQKTENTFRLKLKCPSYYKKLTLYAVDTSGPFMPALPVAFETQKGKGKEELFLEIKKDDLKTLFTPGHKYRWVVIPEESGQAYAESEEIFLWSP